MKKILKKKPVLAVSPGPDVIANSAEPVGTETVVIYDECGDSMWDPVLAQEQRIIIACPALKGD